ncbi:MAG: hypothetical protein XE11_0908 [Methanomicrobiales archaeon 53_19]|nr:MAG: hypothetical protein XE11_0908 [Methanomicrobiales archaeon 53_19]
MYMDSAPQGSRSACTTIRAKPLPRYCFRGEDPVHLQTLRVAGTTGCCNQFFLNKYTDYTFFCCIYFLTAILPPEFFCEIEFVFPKFPDDLCHSDIVGVSIDRSDGLM